MKAMIFETFGTTPTIEEVPDPTPSTTGVVVRVLASGLCLSDWHGWHGHDPDIRLPHVPGHELVGEITEVGRDVNRFKAGDRITVPFVSGCGKCEWCKSGNPQICDTQFQPGFTAWGSFAEFVALEYADNNLVKLPDTLSSVDAASLGCRFITSFRAIADQAELKKDEWIAVYGCGGVGLSAIMIAKALGARVIAIDIDNDTLDLAGKLGADQAINASNCHVVEAVQDLTKGGAHVSVDALGSKETCVNSIKSLRKQGRHIQIGLMAGADYLPEIPMHLVIANELKLIGSHGMQAFRYAAIFDLLEKNLINPSLLVSKCISLSEAIQPLVEMGNFGQKGIMVIDKFSS